MDTLQTLIINAVRRYPAPIMPLTILRSELAGLVGAAREQVDGALQALWDARRVEMRRPMPPYELSQKAFEDAIYDDRDGNLYIAVRLIGGGGGSP